jgi:hypothetical protein
MTLEPIAVFFSYSRKDEALMRELESHLSPLQLNGSISSWYDGCLTPGEEWDTQIKKNLEKAKIILLLISSDFISSGYSYHTELTKAIERHQAGEAFVIPIILRHCLWKQVPVRGLYLGSLQALPKNAKPISEWPDRDRAFLDIVEGISNKIQQFRLEQAKINTEQFRVQYTINLQQYQHEFEAIINTEYPLSQESTTRLRSLQQHLHLKEEDVAQVEKLLREKAESIYRKKLHQQLIEKNLQEQLLSTVERPSSKPIQTKDSVGQEIQNNGPTRDLPPHTRPSPQRIDQGLNHPALNATANFSGTSPSQPLGSPFEQLSTIELNQDFAVSEVQMLKPSFDDLTSEILVGDVYAKLKDLLIDQDWLKADEETEIRILELINRRGFNIRLEDIKKIPSQDLKNIDSLWVKYSEGRFGFSVQKRVWQALKEDVKYGSSWKKIGRQLGWQKQRNSVGRVLDWFSQGISPLEGYEWIAINDIQFNLFAPEGHLPLGPFSRSVGSISHYRFLSTLNP